jgi:hypothetical protein
MFIFDDCPQAWSRLWLNRVLWDHVYFWLLSSGLITTMIESCPMRSCLLLMIVLRPDHDYDWIVSFEIMFIFDDCPQAWSRLWLNRVLWDHVYFLLLSSGLITTMIESCPMRSCLLLMIVLRPDHDFDWIVSFEIMFIFDYCPQAWSRLWLSRVRWDHVYNWWLSSGLIATMIESSLLMIVLRPDHNYDWVMFIIDDCPQAWSRLWLSHFYFWWLSSGLITRLWLSLVYYWWLSLGPISTMTESCLFSMIVLRPDHDDDWVVSHEIMFIIDDCPQAWSLLWLSRVRSWDHVYFWWLPSGLITTMNESCPMRSCLLLTIVLRPQAWSRLWLSHVYYLWLSSGLITTMIESCPMRSCLSLMIVLRPDHDYDWVIFIIHDCSQAWSRLWLSHVYYWWLSLGLILTMIGSRLFLMIVLRPDHDYDWVMIIFDDCPQAWSRLWLSHDYFWWLSSGLITTMIESCPMRSCLLLMIVLRPDHDYDWIVSYEIMFIIDDCPQAWSRLWLSRVRWVPPPACCPPSSSHQPTWTTLSNAC